MNPWPLQGDPITTRPFRSSTNSSFDRVVKTTVFITDLADFATVNEVYATFFRDLPPARSTVQVAGLPAGALVEIEAVALA